MERTIKKAVELAFGTEARNIEPLGGGFYGRAFSVKIDTEPYTVVAKLYLFKSIAVREAEQLRILKKHAVLKMPKVYKVLEVNKYPIEYDVLFMEHISGRNAGKDI